MSLIINSLHLTLTLMKFRIKLNAWIGKRVRKNRRLTVTTKYFIISEQIQNDVNDRIGSTIVNVSCFMQK